MHSSASVAGRWPRSTASRTSSARRNSRFHIPCHAFDPTIDGKLLELTQTLFTFFEKNDFTWKKSVAGCALSHTLVWAQLASEQAFVKNYLILEDDQRFANSDWQKQLAIAMSCAPADAELLY
jgi:GR25 family glycosyltransferase involved in LPS biosynthesis